MRKFLLFSDAERWTLPKAPEGSGGIHAAFGANPPNFSSIKPVRFIGQGNTDCDEATAILAIAWEPPPLNSYPDDESETWKIISDSLRDFLSKDDICCYALHATTDVPIREKQKELINSIASERIGTEYNHADQAPYDLYCNAIKAADTADFTRALSSLAAWFQPPEVPAHRILLSALPEYLSGRNLGAALPGTDEDWMQFGHALEPAIYRVEDVKAKVEMEIASSPTNSDRYNDLCKAMMTLINRRT